MIPILDAGHGSLINNVYYCSAGGRKVITPEFSYYEGESNRAIVHRIVELLALNNVPFYVLSPEYTDPALSVRVKRANDIYAINRNTYLISFHSNAGGGTGFEIFTSIGETTSDKIATFFGLALKEKFPNFRFREDKIDGDIDKEANYTILSKTNCPSILVENLFFDNPDDLKYLIDFEFRQKMAEFYYTKIKELYQHGL